MITELASLNVMVVIIMISNIKVALLIVIATIVTSFNVVSCKFIIVAFISLIAIFYDVYLVSVRDNTILRIEDSLTSSLMQTTILINSLSIHLTRSSSFRLLLLSTDMIIAYSI